VLIIPGPGVIYVIARSLSQGQAAGLISALGLSLGALLHVVAATIGLSAILLTSATAFGFVKLLGAGYLIYLGIRALLSKQQPAAIEAPLDRSLYRLFMDGILVSVLNPKIAIFLLAFLPQFIDPVQGPAAQQVLILGLIYVLLALLTDGSYAILASRIRRWLSGRVLQGPLPRYSCGLVYLGLGVSTAFADLKR
jgi:threonine/homoserine/homoserine lactone efflux protein